MTHKTSARMIVCAFALLTTPGVIGQDARAASSTDATAVFAGGCFWGVEAVFEHVRGVRSVISGYARHNAGQSRSEVPTEAVRITYDPSTVTFEQLLDVFFTIAHDPTSRDRQGPDEGPEYRAVVYYENAEQHTAAEAYVAAAGAWRRFGAAIVTEIRSLGSFRVAEPFHQNYAAQHPADPYIVYNDLPKLRHLQQTFPALYQKNRAP